MLRITYYMYWYDLHVSMYSRILLVEKREAFSVLYSICITYAYENDKHTTVWFTNEAASLIADRKVGENSWGLHRVCLHTYIVLYKNTYRERCE